MFVLRCALLVALAAQAAAYESGAGTKACTAGIPGGGQPGGHGQIATGAGGHTLTFAGMSGTTFTAGQKYTVTLAHATAPFKGFLLAAADGASGAFGQDPAATATTKVMACAGQGAVTQKKGFGATSVAVTWTAPATGTTAKVRWTALQTGYGGKIYIGELTLTNAVTVAPTAPSTAPTSAPTVAGITPTPTAAPTSAAPTAAPTAAVPTPASACGEWCSITVDSMYTLRWKKDGIRISVEAEIKRNAWVAWGLSNTGQMIGSDAVIGVPGVGGGTVQKYTLGGKSMASVTPNIVGQQTLTGTSIAQVNGVTKMAFSKLLVDPGGVSVSATDSNKFIFAYGTVNSNALSMHAGTARGAKAFLLSSAVVQTLDVGSGGTVQSLHGILMYIAFGILMPLAIISSQARGRIGPNWIVAHKRMQVGAVVIAFAGFITGVAMVESESSAHFTGTHKVTGLLVCIFVFLQPLNALIRPDHHVVPKPLARTVWEVVHKGLGYTCVFAGLFNMSGGMDLHGNVRDVYGWHYGWCVVLALVSVAVWVDRLRPKDAGSAHAEHVP